MQSRVPASICSSQEQQQQRAMSISMATNTGTFQRMSQVKTRLEIFLQAVQGSHQEQDQ